MKTDGTRGPRVMLSAADTDTGDALVTPLRLSTRLACVIASLPYFKGRRRAERYIMRHLAPKDPRVIFRCKPGLAVDGNLDVPYVRKLFWMREIEGITTEFSWRWLRGGDLFYDIGANVGYFTMLAACKLQAQGLVVALEPNPIAREQLRASLRANQFRDVIVRSEALGSKSSSRTLTEPDDQTDHSTFGELDRAR